MINMKVKSCFPVSLYRFVCAVCHSPAIFNGTKRDHALS